MDINSLYTSFYRAPSAPRFSPKEIQNKILKWFQEQPFKPIALTYDQRTKLREQFDKICSERNKIDSLVNYVSARMLFPLCPLGLDPLLEILEKDKPSIADYKYLGGALKALFTAYQNYSYRVRNDEVYSFYKHLWNNNYFIPPGTPFDGEYMIKIDETSYRSLKPESLILVMALLGYISGKPDEFLPMIERTAVPDRVIFKLIYDSKKYQDPELDKIIKGFFGLHQLSSCMDILSKITVEETTLTLPDLPYKEFVANLFPNRFENFVLGKDHFFSEIEKQIGEMRGKLENVYGTIVAKMEKMKNDFPHKANPNFHVLFPEPFKTLDEFKRLLDSIVSFKLRIEAEERWERIEKEVDEQIAFEKSPKEFPGVVPSSAKPFASGTESGLLTWFDRRNDPFYSGSEVGTLSQTKKDKIRFNHNLARIVDDIALKYGKCFVKTNENGNQQHLIWMAVHAETPFSKKAKFYSLTMIFNDDGTLYHRALTKKSQAILVDEMVALDDSKKESPMAVSNIEISPELLEKVADDGSYILKVDGNEITVADPKLPLADGSPTLIHLMVI